MLGRVIDSANDVLKGMPQKQIEKRVSAPPKNLIAFPKPTVHYPIAIDGPDGAA